jgi:hypothetical protein
MRLKLVNGAEIDAKQYEAMVGTVNVNTTRGEVKARTGDWHVVFGVDGCSFVMTDQAFQFMVEGAEILSPLSQNQTVEPSALNVVEEQSADESEDESRYNEAAKEILKKIEAEKAGIRAQHPDLKETFDQVEKAVDQAAEAFAESLRSTFSSTESNSPASQSPGTTPGPELDELGFPK